MLPHNVARAETGFDDTVFDVKCNPPIACRHVLISLFKSNEDASQSLISKSQVPYVSTKEHLELLETDECSTPQVSSLYTVKVSGNLSSQVEYSQATSSRCLHKPTNCANTERL